MSKELFENSTLSQAAYAFMPSSITGEQRSTLVSNVGNFTDEQFDDFAARYPLVITQVTDPVTGFSATVFKDTTSSTGNLTIAFRGTEVGPLDIGSDFVLATDGAAFDQIISMYN